MTKKIELLDLLSQDERSDFYSEADKLKDDIHFFKAYMRRNKTSMANFNVNISIGLCRQFLSDIWDNYGYVDDTDTIQQVYLDYLLAKKAMAYIADKTDKDVIIKICKYFKETHEMNLADYVGDFIGCSRGCMDACKYILMEIEPNLTKEN